MFIFSHVFLSLLASFILMGCTLDVVLETDLPGVGSGSGPISGSPSPIEYSNFFKSLTTGGAAVYQNMRHTCGVTQDENVICWGSNTLGQLGHPDSDENSFLKVKGGDQGGEFLSGVKQITAGQGHTCALIHDKSVYCWGRLVAIGGGSSLVGNQTEPRRVLAGDQSHTETFLTDVDFIDAGFDYTCALTSDRSVYCWGAAKHLGSGASAASSVPLKVVSGQQGLGVYLQDITSLSVGFRTTCALDASKNVYCWGDGRGVGAGFTSGWSFSPVKTLGGEQGGTYLENIKQVLGGWNTGCAVEESGALYCWGSEASPLASSSDQTYPSRILRAPEVSGQPLEYLDDVKSLVGGAGYCASLELGKLVCWGLYPIQTYPTLMLSSHSPDGQAKNLVSMDGKIGTFWFYDDKGRSYGFGVNYFNTFRGASAYHPSTGLLLYDEKGE